MHNLPILYSFRRCPYAMRARLGLLASGNKVELREVILRDKPPSMLEASPKGTVPVLLKPDGAVLEESRDIMEWAVAHAEPGSEAAQWAAAGAASSEQMNSLIDENDGPFKQALDAYKYPDRFPETDRVVSRENGAAFILKLDARLQTQDYLTGEEFSYVDAAILPFVRQFAHVDQEWFYAQGWTQVIAWLDAFKQSERFTTIMPKFSQWREGEAGVVFGA